ncbi:unnamed protein product [Heterobilharzia americana]|nr:unnamed protein product [Heterobilharzia americana]
MPSDALFSAISRRDPSKRQIKPVNTDHLALLDDLDDDSDSEYVCEERDEDDEVESDSVGTDEEDSNSIDSSVDSLSTHDSETHVISQHSLLRYESDSPKTTKGTDEKYLSESACTGPVSEHNLLKTADIKLKDVDIMICMLCLGDSVDPNDELIECDGCGIVVHEDCYKVVDSIFLSSGASSSSTDAWFCEPCLAGLTSPICELCPVLDGVFKRTDNNRWVHLLCALYTPGVAFNDPDNLMDVTLTELPQRQWSLHECSLCEDRFFAWTGVCISCDAGLCRTYFHVTCAQKHGLLSEPTIEESSADPFFAHCRQHTDKTVARHRRRNFLTAVLRLRKWRSNKQFTLDCLEEKKLSHVSVLSKASPVDPRIQRKLEHYRELYKDLLKHRGKPYERERKITEVSKRISTLQNTQRELQISDASASHSYNSVTTELENIITRRGKLYVKFSNIINTLRSLIPELKCSSELEVVLSDSKDSMETAAFDLTSSKLLDSSKTVKFGSSAVISASKRKCRPLSPPSKIRKFSKSDAGNQNNNASKDATASHLDKCQSSVTFEPENVILECTVCHGLQDQHLITSCDTCGKAFHLACLDPPLIRMPKRSKLYGWQCSFCTKEVSLVPGVDKIDLNAPRQLRRSSGIAPGRTTCVKQDVKANNSNTSADCKPNIDSTCQISENIPTKSDENKSCDTGKSSTPQTLHRSRSSTGSRFSRLSNFTTSFGENMRRKSTGALKTMSSSSSRRLSSVATRKTRRRVASQSTLQQDLEVNIDSKMTTSPSVVMTQVCSADFDQFKFTGDAEEELAKSVSNKKVKCGELDEEIAHLRTSKVIKFVQIRDHESNGESEAVERITPLQQRYVICRESSPQPKRSATSKFRLKFKKL